ncbi:MAG: phytanoyl-CoA dioxygenase family protein [Pseudomonadales bacterium]
MQQDISQSIEACAAHYGDDADAMRQYLLEGQQEALNLPNRGPIVFNADGQLDAAIREAYSEYGFYIFENVLQEQELEDIKADLITVRATFPTHSGAKVTASGQPALGADCEGLNLLWSKPLGDPLGGTAIANGRHQVKLFEPTPKADAPNEVPFVLLGSLQFSETALRVYGHPQLLRVAADINGDDFAPFNETLFLKDAGVGAAVSWHQDGDTHWESEAFDEGIHGFNFMAQVYGSTAVNGVWVIPGSHKLGRLNIKQMVEDAGCERLPDAVPMICKAGDVVICNRQIVHGSFANTGYEPRVTVNFGFHRRSSVLNVEGAGIHSESVIYDEALIRKRSELISYGIDARSQRFPEETPYDYTLKDNSLVWNEAAKQSLKDYNMLDLSI